MALALPRAKDYRYCQRLVPLVVTAALGLALLSRPPARVASTAAMGGGDMSMLDQAAPGQPAGGSADLEAAVGARQLRDMFQDPPPSPPVSDPLIPDLGIKKATRRFMRKVKKEFWAGIDGTWDFFAESNRNIRGSPWEREHQGLPGLFEAASDRDLQLKREIMLSNDPVKLLQTLMKWMKYNVTIDSIEDPKDPLALALKRKITRPQLAEMKELIPFEIPDKIYHEMAKNRINQENTALFLEKMANFNRWDNAFVKLMMGTYKQYTMSWRRDDDIDANYTTAPWYVALKRTNTALVDDIFRSLFLDTPQQRQQWALLSDNENIKPEIPSDLLARSIYALGQLPMVHPKREIPQVLIDIADQSAREHDFHAVAVVKLLYGLAWMPKDYPSSGEVLEQNKLTWLDEDNLLGMPSNFTHLDTGRTLSLAGMKALEEILMDTHRGRMAACDLTPLECVQTLFGFAKLAYAPDARLTRFLEERAFGDAGMMDIQSLSELVWAIARLAQLNPEDPPTGDIGDLRRLEAQILKISKKHRLTMRALAPILWGFTVLRYAPGKTFMDTILNHEGPVQDMEQMPADIVSQLAIGLAHLRVNVDEKDNPEMFMFWHYVREEIKFHIPKLPIAQTIDLMYALAELDVCHRPDVEPWNTDIRYAHMGDEWATHKPQTPLMELLWKHLTEVLAQDRHFDGSKIDQDRLAKLFEAYQYAKLMDDKLNPVPVGVQALEQDNHLKLPATYSRVLLDSLKAAEKEQKGWESNLIPAVTENLKGLGLTVEPRRGVGCYKLLAAVTGIPPHRRKDIKDKRDKGVKGEEGFKFAVLWREDTAYSRNTHTLIGSTLKEKTLRARGYEPIWICKEDYAQASRIGRSGIVKRAASRALTRARRWRRLERLKERERDRDLWMPDEFVDLLGTKNRRTRQLETWEDKNHKVSLQEWFELANPDPVGKAKKDEVPTRRIFHMRSRTTGEQSGPVGGTA